jgi:hypothetical protein
MFYILRFLKTYFLGPYSFQPFSVFSTESDFRHEPIGTVDGTHIFYTCMAGMQYLSQDHIK